MLLYIGSDNLIKLVNLVRKSFAEDEQIDNATAKLTLFRAIPNRITATRTRPDGPPPARPVTGTWSNLGAGNVSVMVSGSAPSPGDVIGLYTVSSPQDEYYTVISADPSEAIAEVQTLATQSLLTAGTYKLLLLGKGTAELAFNASVADIQAAINAALTQADDVVVSGDPLSVGTLTLTYHPRWGNAPAAVAFGPVTMGGQQQLLAVAATEVTRGRLAGQYTEVKFAADFDLQALTAVQGIYIVAAGAIDKGDGKVGIPALNHGLKAGNKIRIWGTRNYDGVHEVTQAGTRDFTITAEFAAEEFSGNEYFHLAMPGAVEIEFTPEGSGGNYSAIIPDAVQLLENNQYLLEIKVVQGESDLLSRITCTAVFHPKIVAGNTIASRI